MAIISLEDMHFYAYHGFYREERLAGGEFVIDLWVEAPAQEAALQDDLFKTVNYEKLYLFCQSEMRQPAHLIETVAQRIIGRITGHFPGVQGVRIRLQKCNPPLGGRVGKAAVEMAIGSLARS
jgi:dihydroneopterin aldolase